MAQKQKHAAAAQLGRLALLGILLSAGAAVAADNPQLAVVAPLHSASPDPLPPILLRNESASAIQDLEAMCIVESLRVGTSRMSNTVTSFRVKALEPDAAVAVSCAPAIRLGEGEMSGTIRIEARYVYGGMAWGLAGRFDVSRGPHGRVEFRER